MLRRIRNILFVAVVICIVSSYLITFKKITVTPSVLIIKHVPPNRQFIVVTFHTGGEKYVNTTKRLLESCKRLDLECIPSLLPPQKVKTRILSQKSRFILSQLDRYQKPVLWVDCDLVFYKFPYVITSEMNEGQDAMFINWDMSQTYILKTLSGVMYFNNTQKSRLLLSYWNNALLYSTNKDAPDDQVIETFFTNYTLKYKMNITYLPKEYLQIEGWYGRAPNEVIGHPDSNSGWSSIRPQIPPWNWLTGHYVVSSPADYLIVWTCAESQSGLLSQLGKVSIGQSCTVFNITITFWEPVILVGIDTDLKAQINLLLPDPHFLGCSIQKYTRLAKSGNTPTTPIICAERCRDNPYFSMTDFQQGECWCGQERVDTNLDLCKMCDNPDLKRLCPKEVNVGLFYRNVQQRVLIEDLSHIGMVGREALEYYVFEVKKKSEDTFSWFKPTVIL